MFFLYVEAMVVVVVIVWKVVHRISVSELFQRLVCNSVDINTTKIFHHEDHEGHEGFGNLVS